MMKVPRHPGMLPHPVAMAPRKVRSALTRYNIQSMNTLDRVLRLFTAASLGFCLLASPATAQQSATRPTLFYVGDSTVKAGAGDGANGQWGWGDHTAAYFDSTRVRIVNRALGGRSSRTYITQGHWERVLEEIHAGDVVLIQFGHNDVSAVNDAQRARGTLGGVGDDSAAIDNMLTGEHEVVYTFGAYLRRYVDEVRARGATPVLVSLVPRNIHEDGRFRRDGDTYAGWTRLVAERQGVPFIDLNELVATEYDRLGPAGVAPLFHGDDTHTSLEGARLTARLLVGALRDLEESPVTGLLSEEGEALTLPVAPRSAPPRSTGDAG